MNLHQRLALLTGASLCALALAGPVNAATTPGLEHRITGDNVDDTLTISSIGNNDIFGVTADGTPSASASVGSPDSGGIEQIGFATGTPPGSGDLLMSAINSGDITIQAIAHAANGSGGADALAFIPIAVEQFGDGRNSSSISLDNSGSLAADAVAKAAGTTAIASATMLFGVNQGAIQVTATDGAASIALDNKGSIDFSASAVADADLLAVADANVRTGIHQQATADAGAASIAVTNDGTIAVSAGAEALASSTSAGRAAAFASARGLQQTALAVRTSSTTAGSGAHQGFSDQPSGPASVFLDNNGTVSVAVHAGANAGSQAIAIADDLGIFQQAVGNDASAAIDNKGRFDGFASAIVTGGHSAVAVASAAGLIQLASAERSLSSATASTSALHFRHFRGGAGPADVSLTNSGTISMVANAHALATDSVQAGTGVGSAAAVAEAGGIGQFALGFTANESLDNDGSIIIQAAAAATGAQNAFARVNGNGFGQHASAVAVFTSLNFGQSAFSGFAHLSFTGDAALQFTNSGILDVEGSGSANGGGQAIVVVDELGGDQDARARIADLAFGNSGTFSVQAIAKATGAAEAEHAAASGALQLAQGASSALVSVVNSGKAQVEAVAHGTARTGLASNVALAGGFGQEPLSIGTATASMANSGIVSVDADAKAVSGGTAFAGALARGIVQDPSFGTLKAALDNKGQIEVVANASAIGTSAFALASAKAYLVDAANVNADVDNSGSLVAQAVAAGSGAVGSAVASAVGIGIVAMNHSSVTAAAGALGGSLVNAGKIDVSAKVDSAHSGTVGATASGISISATRNNLSVTNSGTINVKAVSGSGGPARASGVRVITSPAPTLPPRPNDQFTFTNDGGTIVARESTDGGKSWHRGMAIDVSEASNSSVINLLGNGLIYGDVGLRAGDRMNVQSWTTYFDGVINPAALPAGGITVAALDSRLSGAGSLNIGKGGNLVLADGQVGGAAAMSGGPSGALVDTLNVAADGTLTFEFQPAAGGAQPAGSYPQVFAGTANLGGTLVANVTTANGLFANSYSWDNVIDSNQRNGTFHQCNLGGADAGSVLLELSCSYDANQNVDLSLKRIAFNAVGGLNANGMAAGTGLENVYSADPAGSRAQIFRDLLKINPSSSYNLALNQLSGSAYANYLNSFASLGVHEDDLADRATNCEVPVVAQSVVDCRPGPLHVWGQIDYQKRSADADSEAGANRSKRYSGLVGIDSSIGDSVVVGAGGGVIKNDLHDGPSGDLVKGDGWTAGAYGVFDRGTFFVKGVATYSALNGDSTRHIDFAGLAPGATFAATPRGSPNIRMLTGGLHGGARFPMGSAVLVSPYLNLDYVRASLRGFTERDGGGAALTVESSHSNHPFLTGGVTAAAHVLGLVPQVDLGYRYRFGNERSAVGASFSGSSSAGFDIVSAAQKKAAFLAGLSVGGHRGPVDVRIGYEGEFNGSFTSHSANFKLVLPLGGHSTAHSVPEPSKAPAAQGSVEPPAGAAQSLPSSAPTPPPPPQDDRGA